MSEKIKVLHKVVRVKMPPCQQDVRMRRCTDRFNKGGVKSMKGLGGGKPFGTYLEFKRIGPEGLSPQPANTLGYGSRSILRAYKEARQALKQYVWEHK